MNKIILSKQQVIELVGENKYRVDRGMQMVSRCIDGRYQNKIQNPNDKIQMPALAIPGADAGELALIFATANSYGLEVDMQKATDSLIEVVGGEKNLQFHTDFHAKPGVALAGCGHLKQIGLDVKAYDLTSEQLSFIKDKFEKTKQSGVEEIILQGEHQEGAVLMIRGNWGVHPQGAIQTDLGKKNVSVFIFHQSLADKRRKLFAQILIKNKAVILPEKCDDEYLYNALCETGENHLMETSKRLAKGLPIYQVEFKEDGRFKIEEMGMV